MLLRNDLPESLTHEGGVPHPPPPPPAIEEQREMFFPTLPFRFHPLDLGIAVGLAGAVFMLLSFVVASAFKPSAMGIFKDIFLGFDMSFPRLLIGVLWAFAGGFVFGAFAGFLYNWRLRSYVASPQH